MRGLKQKEVAKILGLADCGRISLWENGICLPSAENLLNLAAVYRAFIESLYPDQMALRRAEMKTREEDIRGFPEMKQSR
jgi:transcriptional regulator with XRE-family HTH domain